ncbi:propanediol utilization protein [Salipiger sp.]|uniref:propanediol utilization protein n=1 Tax=Salipiger sp. TaxID=2078585 RepID=UPI003A96E349
MTFRRVEVQGHFGEWLQGRMGPAGPVALVTVRCPAHTVRAPAPGPALFEADRLGAFARALGLPSGLPSADCNFPAGAGGGASTATLVAIARAAGFAGCPEALARACLAIEGASDPLMFPDPDRLLWASREARVLRTLPAPPRCTILGGFWGPPLRTDPLDPTFPDVSDLVAAWELAVTRRDLLDAAQVAGESARRCTGLRGPLDPTADLARDLGALGWLRAHTGSARGLVYRPGAVSANAADTLREAGFAGVLTFETGAE